MWHYKRQWRGSPIAPVGPKAGDPDGESIRTIATGLGISIGVVHKALNETTSSNPIGS
jgi:hypothetical protein